MAEEVKKRISIGAEDLKNIVQRNGYYVDKTPMIKELIDSNSAVTLLTRPRRFGKTLNQSMLRRFFEDERTETGEAIDNRWVFNDLAVSTYGTAYLQHQQKYPVINLSMKSGKQPAFELAYENLKEELRGEFYRHRYILENGTLNDRLKQPFEAILTGKGEALEYSRALRILSECLQAYHGEKAIILIDEYDVPLENAYFEGFYDKMSSFIRALFESALKTNDCVEFAVITGCLRISKESIFTGLNNLEVNSTMSPHYADAFGFTEQEVQDLLAYYDLQGNFTQVKEWYDGYRFGSTEIYNPWSILSYVRNAEVAPGYLPRPYWSNTSSNSIVKELVVNADKTAKIDIEELLGGRTIEKPVHEEVTYADISGSQDNLWNFLYFTGYLKAVSEELRGDQLYMRLAIPNRELRSIFKNTVQEWFTDTIKTADLSPLRTALEQGDCAALGSFISEKLMETISYFDYDERFYHGFLTGMLTGMGGYDVLSNRESGEGRPDIILKEQKFCGRAFLIEVKVADSFPQMQARCQEALQQIEDQKYEADLLSEGYQISQKYGLCFFRKGCIAMADQKRG